MNSTMWELLIMVLLLVFGLMAYNRFGQRS